MRVYFLKLESSDFVTQDGNSWTTGTIDLYENNSYTNYSIAKSSFGSNLLGNQTWTGLNVYSPTATESGHIVGGRFVDTSGRVDIVSYNENIVNNTSQAPIHSRITIYTSDSSSSIFPDEWTQGNNFSSADEINLIESPRYIRIRADFDVPDGVSYTPSLYIRLEIDVPVMAPLYSKTKTILNKFPEWMAMRELDSVSATPESLGGEFLNAIAGEWLDNINNELSYLALEQYIETVDLNQKAWIYKTHVSDQFIYSILGDSIAPAHAADIDEFYNSTPDEDVIIWDEENDVVYSNKLYDDFMINGVQYSQEPHHLWNSVDEIGLSVDLNRLHLESNFNYQQRILDVYRNPIGVSLENFKLTLRRELDLWRLYGSTPDSSFQGATPEILEILDIEQDPTFVDYEGLPTNKFKNLADDNANRRPVTWGKFRWDKAIWDVGGEQHKGFGTLPQRFDATPYPDELTQSGIGDGNDLFAFHPNVITGPRDVKFRLRARGKVKTARTEYPPVDIEFYLYGQADRTVYNNPVKNVWLTVEVVTNDSGSPVYYYSFQASNQSNVDVDRITSTSYSTTQFMDADGTGTDHSLAFAKKTTGVSYNNTGFIPNNKITSVSLFSGKWEVSSQTYILKEVSDTFLAYFSHDESETLIYNTSNPSVPSYGFNMATPSTLPRPRVVMKSKVTSSSTQTWTSPRTPFKITVNTAAPPTSTLPVVVTIPTVIFDPYVNTSTEIYVVELKVADPNGIYGAYSHHQDGTDVFLDYSNIKVNNNNTWASNIRKTYTASSTTTLTFSVDYSISNSVYEQFESPQNATFTGMLDENGPYKNGVIPNFGNTNFILSNLTPTRSDFDIPDNDDYIVNWIGVDVVDDTRTIAWLDSNTVKPAFPVDEISYPSNSIVETYDSGIYSFGPFAVKTRLKTDPDIEWLPQIHSGYFYQNQQEYYLYAEAKNKLLSSTPTSFQLDDFNYQGAPIIVRTVEATPVNFRQIAPTLYMEPNPATPSVLGIEYAEEKYGNGSATLYAAYDDIYNITVKNLTTGQYVTLVDNESSTNHIDLTTTSNKDTKYLLTYTVNNSFVAYNEDKLMGKPYTLLTFDKSPATAGTDYLVTYESSRFDPATPVNTPLNPQYTSLDEAFLFVSYNEYTLDQIELYLSPSKMVADGYDYIVATIRALDVYGNPKPNQTLNLSTTFGNINPTQVKTDNDGCAFAIVTSIAAGGTPSGTVTAETIGNSFVVSEAFDISQYTARDGRLLSSIAAEQMPADGLSKNTIVGRVESGSFVPTPYAYVRWRKSRSLYEVLNYTSTPYYNGTVVANSSGIFNIGPFTSATPDSGYWFVSMESDSASPSGNFTAVGDVIYWYEYPQAEYGIENFSGLPRAPIQQATPVWNAYYGGIVPPYSPINQFPSNYDEATPKAPATPNHGGGHVFWLPPKWFALPKYIQYQLGLLGDIIHRDTVNISVAIQKALKDRKWI